MEEKKLVDLKIKLRHDGLNQSDFFSSVVELYLNDSEVFLNSIEKIKLNCSRFNKTKIKKTMKLYKKGLENMKDYALTEKERDEVFDILEHEIGDL